MTFFVTKNCDMLITEIFINPFCVKGRYQEKYINVGKRKTVIGNFWIKKLGHTTLVIHVEGN